MNRRERAARALLGAFVLAAVADLVALAAGADTGHTVVKPLLMPLLAAHAVARGGPPLLLGALLFGCAGDTLLLFDTDPAFLAGMASFAAGHVCYLVLFARLVRFTARARAATWIPIAYGAVLVGTVTLLWPDLPAELRGPVAAYSLLLTAMAYGAGRLGWTAGIGGALFLLSDTLIATGVAEWPQLPRPDLWVMGTYLAAQYLLTRGVLEAQRATVAARRPAATSGSAAATP
ncbi:lysoplasmalogenase [Streptomyces jeddahensis]|uniref:YhhN-like protein n=1 Tax=Streptomyces jeddahensis TaxID=1716141 RepID=A0A177I121_9ACTN|nr:lysoplasmalogenase [Streptomyces jeddahensis]OAH16519.1 YhhN-like protein [Streptomyces jeddahensis]